MFLTTEPNLPWKNYSALRVVAGAASIFSTMSDSDQITQAWNQIVRQALAELESQAEQLGADGVIGVQVSTHSQIHQHDFQRYHAIATGTAIKFEPMS